MPPVTVTFDRVIITKVIIFRDVDPSTGNGIGPVSVTAEYTVMTSDGRFPQSKSLSPAVQGGTQTTLQNLWNMLLTAVKAQEGINGA